ncbi:MAG TPA: 16S rRNA (guanine(966)-N(2))-methyltransferase RsmD [Acidimicrobiia bacterium]|nr:16S rRNA (guanine(966)-N(2))-methyltransferase RsmD [Acidimicrobiia bacterium]
MRVIAGSAKGRALIGPDTRDTRPLTDRAKEGIFSALGEAVEDAEVLDLYAGSGSIGIEALSRGARRATFVEHGRKALVALRQNLVTLGFANRAVVSNRGVANFLASADGSFDLVFLDPPWSLPDEQVVREIGAATDLVTGELVVHRRRTSPVPPAPVGWRLRSVYRYGDSHLLRYAQQYGDETERP